MSRIGKLPIKVPSGVSVEEKNRKVTVKGPKGSLELSLRPEVDLEVRCSLRVLTETWLGHKPMAKALRDGDVTAEGTRRDVKRFSDWFEISMFSAAGREPVGAASG